MSRIAVRALLLLLLALFADVVAADADDIEVAVALDTAEQTGSATATVRAGRNMECRWPVKPCP